MGYWRLVQHFSIEVKTEGFEEYTMVIPEGTLTNEGATDKDNLGTTYLAKQNFDFEQIYRTRQIRLCLWDPLRHRSRQ